MPRPNQTLTQREQEICERVHFARKEIIKWTQPALAKEIGITQNQLAGIEYKRAPLRLASAKVICEKFNISQRWLALGVLPIQPRFDVLMECSVLVNKDSLFSWYFDNYQDHITRVIEQVMIGAIGEENFRSGNFDEADPEYLEIEDPPALAVPFFMKIAVEHRFNSLPEDLKIEYGLELLRVNKEFQKKHSKQIAGTGTATGRETPKKPVDNISLTAKNEAVKHSLKNLFDRLKKATAERGQKTALAKKLGVPPVSVSQWLSGVKEPGGETTLKLLNWVEQEERK